MTDEPVIVIDPDQLFDWTMGLLDQQTQRVERTRENEARIAREIGFALDRFYRAGRTVNDGFGRAIRRRRDVVVYVRDDIPGEPPFNDWSFEIGRVAFAPEGRREAIVGEPETQKRPPPGTEPSGGET